MPINLAERTLNKQPKYYAPTRSLESARRLMERYVAHYNNVHLTGGIGYLTSKNVLDRHQKQLVPSGIAS